MVKKRNAKLASKNNKREISLAERTEQILLTMPSIIATQIGRDLLIQQQQDNKLKLELKKQEAQKKNLTQKMLELKKKNTAAAKKQLKTSQKLLQKTTQAITEVMRNLAAVQKQIQMLSQKKAKYLALQSHLRNFEKDWAKKNNKNVKIKTNSKVKAKVKTTSAKSKPKAKVSKPARQGKSDHQVLEVIEVPVQDSLGLEQVPTPMDKVS